jgi:hypothetical protein
LPALMPALDGPPQVDHSAVDFRWTSSRCQVV